MANGRTPTVRVYVREQGGKRSFYPAPRIPDLTACYWLRYEKERGQAWQRVGHYDLVAREKLLLERRLSAEAQGFILPEDRAAEKASRVTIRAAVDAYLESLRIKKPPTKTISSKTYELGLFTGFCKKSYMDELVSADMLGFRDYLRSEDYAERTVYNYLMTVTTFLKKNGVYRVVGLLEAEDWPEIPRTDPEPYIEEEVRALQAVATEYQRLVIRFFVGTGCREQEVAHVEWPDINWVRKTVWIHAKLHYGWKPKTAAGTRTIPLPDALLVDLKALQVTSTNPLGFPAKTSNALRKHTQSCGCLRREFLKLGPMRASLPMCRPRAVEVTYPVPTNLHPNPLVNEVMRRRYQFRWVRVEFEVRQIERGAWKEPKHVAFVPRDDRGRPIRPLDLRGMMRDRTAERRAQVEDTPASWNTGSSLADRVRVLTPEEWATL